MKQPRMPSRCLLLLLLTLAACRGAGLNSRPIEIPSSRVIVSFGCFESQRLIYEELRQQFEVLHPDTQIELVSLDSLPDTAPVEGRYPDDVWQRWVAAADTLAMAPDLDATRQGLLRDLTPFVQADPAFAPDDFYAGAFESLQWYGGIWGVPTTISGFHGVVFDKEAFAEANVALPRPGWTWDQFLAAAQALTIKENDKGERWGYVERVWDPTPFVVGRSAAWADPTANEGQLALEHPQVIEAVRWYADLALIHRVMPVPDLDSQSATELVGRGQAAMWSANTASLKLSDAQRQLGWAPFPVDSSTSRTTPLTLNSAIMSAQATHPEAAWAWLAFLTREPPDIKAVPARRSVTQERKYWDTLDTQTASSYQYALQHGFFRDRALLGIGEVLYQALQAIFSQQLSIEEALAKAYNGSPASRDDVPATTAPNSTPIVTPKTLVTHHLTFFVWDFNTTAYQLVASRFHAQNPEVTVAVLSMTSLRPAPFSERFPELVQRADCFMAPWIRLDPKELALTLPLDPLWDTDTSLLKGDFYPVAIEMLRQDGQLRALPILIYPSMMFYNQDLLNAADLAAPSLDWTVDEFRTLVVQLTNHPEQVGSYSYMPSPYSLLQDAAYYIEAQGGPLIDQTQSPPSYRFVAPEVLQAVQWYVALSQKDGVMPRWQSKKYSDDLWITTLNNKQAAFWPGSPLSTPGAAFDDAIKLVPMPRGRQQRVTDYRAQAAYISVETEQVLQCWTWLKFLTEHAAFLGGQTSGIPTRLSVLESAEFAKKVGDAAVAAYRSTMLNDFRPVSLGFAGGLRKEQYPIADWLEDTLQAILDGADAASSLQALQNRAERYSACLDTRHESDLQTRIDECSKS